MAVPSVLAAEHVHLILIDGLEQFDARWIHYRGKGSTRMRIPAPTAPVPRGRDHRPGCLRGSNWVSDCQVILQLERRGQGRRQGREMGTGKTKASREMSEKARKAPRSVDSGSEPSPPPEVPTMKCFECGDDAVAICKFCGRAVCSPHARQEVYVTGFTGVGGPISFTSSPW